MAPEFAILPVLAGIEQRAEGAGLLLKSQQLICHAVRRAINDKLVADLFQRHLVVRLVATCLEQLQAAAAFQFGEQRSIIIDIGSSRVGRVGLRSCGVLGDEDALGDAPIRRLGGTPGTFATFDVFRPVAFDPGRHQEVCRDRLPAACGGFRYPL